MVLKISNANQRCTLVFLLLLIRLPYLICLKAGKRLDAGNNTRRESRWICTWFIEREYGEKRNEDNRNTE